MFHRWAALVLVLALCAITPKNAAGQSMQQPRGHGAKGRLGSNYPNPFNPDTYLKFAVGEEGCTPGSGKYVVTMQLVNVLAQPVVDPVLYGTAESSPASALGSQKGARIRNLSLPCGEYVAYWDGRLPDGREASSGVYGEMLFIDGQPQFTKKIYYKK